MKQNRRIQVSGGCSYIVTIPKRWVTKMGLSQGSAVSITWHNGTSLLLSADSQLLEAPTSEKKVTILPVSETESASTTVLKVANLYVSGRNSIHLRFLGRIDNAAKRAEISNLVRSKLIGAEIISDSQERIQIEMLLGNSELSTVGAIRRLASVASLMLDESIESFKTSDRERALLVLENFEADRFSYYAQRTILGSLSHQVSSNGEENSLEDDELGIHLMIARALLEVANCAREIAGRAASHDSDSRGTVEESTGLNVLKQITLQMYNSAILSFAKGDVKTAEEVLEMTRQFERIHSETLRSFENKANANNARMMTLVSVLSSLKRVSGITCDIAELILELLQDNYVEEVELSRVEPMHVHHQPLLLSAAQNSPR